MNRITWIVSLFYVLFVSVIMTVSRTCRVSVLNCDVLSGIIVNCLDFPDPCLTLSTKIQYMLISNNTKSLLFEDGGSITTLIIHDSTTEQLRFLCQLREIETIISNGKIACDIPGGEAPRNMISNAVDDFVGRNSMTSPVPTINVSTAKPHGGHYIAYVIWGGVACSVLILVFIAVIAVMLRKKSGNHEHIEEQFDTKFTEF